MTMTLTREAILATCGKRRIEKKNVPGYGEIYVRSLMESERAAIEEASTTNRKSARVVMIIYCVCNEAGETVFGMDDVGALMKADSRVIVALSEAVASHLKMPEASSVAKNSDGTPGDDSQ